MKALKGGFLGCLGVGAAIAAVIVVIVIIAAASGGSKKKTAVTTSGTSAPGAANSGSSQAPLQPGQSAKVGDVMVTLNAVRVVAPQSFSTPKDGNQYVACDFTVVNTTNKPYTLSTLLSLTMLDSSSRKYNEALLTGLNGSLEGTIPANGQVRGEVAFEVPVAGAPYVCRYAQPTGTGTADWVAAP